MSSHTLRPPPLSVEQHPRGQRIIESWKWKGTILTIYTTCIINGFDVSNVANIQPQLYGAFGHIEYLPWIGLSYSLANFATLAFARRILDIFDIRHTYIASILVFAAGAALAGSAESMSTIIAGRVVMGIGGSVCQNCAISYFSMYASDSQGPLLYSILSALWAVGLVVGGPVGSALAEKVTWRWAFYINLPFLGFAFLCAVIFVPRRRVPFSLPLRRRIAEFAGLDIVLQTITTIATIVLFAIAATFSGPVWSWSSGPCYATWVVFAVVFLICGVLHCKRFTVALRSGLNGNSKDGPDRRVIPIELMGRRNTLPLWIVSGCAGATYAVTLYYLPLFYAFSKGYGALQQTTRMLPFMLTFIATVFIVGACLSKIKHYGVIYVVGGAVTLASGTALAIILDSDVSETKVMGLTALIGVGLGLHFQHGNAISNMINKSLRDRVESAALLNMSLMGGISVALIMAGAIYENRGIALLSSALQAFHYDDEDLREALSGVSPSLWEGAEMKINEYGADATTQAISCLLYIISSSGALCLACGVLILLDMKSKRGNREKGIPTV